MILQRDFYSRNSAQVAKELLGQKMVRKLPGILLIGIICETEAYFDHTDSASHASKGKTPRNSVMFGPAGISYVYFVYGMHNMFNIVTEQEGRAGAVLVRAVFPVDGIESMIQYRNGRTHDLTNGPAKLCQAFRIDRSLNNIDLTVGRDLCLEERETISEKFINSGPRIGIHYAEEKDRNADLRFWLDDMFYKERI